MVNPLLEEGEICCICQEDLLSQPIHILDCSHTYHVKCIMEWFRAPRDGDDEVGDCPLCRHTPHYNDRGRSRRHYYTTEGRVQILKSLCKKKNNRVPLAIVKAMQRLRIAEKELREIVRNNNIFYKTKEIKDMRKEIRRRQNKRWQLERKLCRRKYEVAVFDPLSCINFFS